MTEPLLSTAQAGVLLGRSQRFVSDLCAAGELEHYRFESVGGRVTFKVAESAIRAYLNRARQSAS